MKNYLNGTQSGLKSPFTSSGISGPTKPTAKTVVSVKKSSDPASSYVPHKCPVPNFVDQLGRQRTL